MKTCKIDQPCNEESIPLDREKATGQIHQMYNQHLLTNDFHQTASFFLQAACVSPVGRQSYKNYFTNPAVVWKTYLFTSGANPMVRHCKGKISRRPMRNNILLHRSRIYFIWRKQKKLRRGTGQKRPHISPWTVIHLQCLPPSFSYRSLVTEFHSFPLTRKSKKSRQRAGGRRPASKIFGAFRGAHTRPE